LRERLGLDHNLGTGTRAKQIAMVWACAGKRKWLGEEIFNSWPTFSPYLHNTVCSGLQSHSSLLRFTPGLFTLEWTHRATFAWLQAWTSQVW